MSDTGQELPFESVYPALPTELFGRIIDLLCERFPGALLSDEQLSTVKSCSLVCSSFVPLSRKHIFQCLGFSLPTPPRLHGLAQLLETSPDAQKHPRHLKINIRMYIYFGRSVTLLSALNRVLLAFIPLPFIESVTILSPHDFDKERGSTLLNIGTLCGRLVQDCVSRGTLQTLIVMGKIEPPITVSGYASLHTLYLDQGNFNFTQPAETIKYLSLRKMEVPVSFFFYFPALESLRISRCNFINAIPVNPTTSLAPPPTIKHLNLELSSMAGEQNPQLMSSLSTFLDFFRTKSREQGIEPFAKLRTIEISISGESCNSDLSVLRALLRDTKMLESLSFQVYPMFNIAPFDLFENLRVMMPALPLKLTGHLGNLSQINDGVPPVTQLQGVLMLPWFCREIPLDIDTVITPTRPNAETQAAQNIHNTVELSQWSSFLRFLTTSSPSFEKIDEVEVCVVIEYEEKDAMGVPAWNWDTDNFSQGKSCILGTSFNLKSASEPESGTRSTLKVILAAHEAF